MSVHLARLFNRTQRSALRNFALVTVLICFVSGLVSIAPQSAQAAVASAPVITSITRGDGSLSIAFTQTAATPAVTNYEYSLDGGTTWVARTPASTVSPLAITGLTNCQSYQIAIRAVNTDGNSLASEVWTGVPGTFTYQLNNGLMRFGNGVEASILANGNLKQPFYNKSGSWYQLTYGSNPLSYAIAVGGDGTSEWNTNGSRVDFSSISLSRQSIDCSGFVTTNNPAAGGVAIGYGVLTTSGNAVIGTQTVKVTRTYRLTATGKYASFSESVTNISASSLTNARLWVGTSDDYVAGSDSPNKIKGNISGGTFTQLASQTTQSRALQIVSGSDIVYFYTTSNLGYTSWNSCCSFANAMNQNPLTQAVSSGNGDGSYALYLRFQDIAPGASESFNWYYIATSAADAPSVLNAVSNIALPAAPTVSSVTAGSSQATVNFTPGSSGGSSLTNYQYSIDGGVNWLTRSPASTQSPLVISGLTNGQTYNVQLRAVNSEGSGTATTSSSVTPIGPPQSPLITSLTQTDTTIDVAFDPPASNGGATISNYEYSVDGGSTWIAPSPADVASPVSITGLTPGTSYQVALRAVNSQGAGTSSPSQTVKTLSEPAAPVLGTVTPGDGSLSVVVNLGDTGGSPLTNLQYSLDGGASWISRNPASTYTPLFISGLTNGTSYDIAVRAVNAIGHSSASNIVIGKPQTTPGSVVLPLNTNVVPSSRSLTLSFTAPADGGSPVTSYQYSTDRGATWHNRTDSGADSTTLMLDKLSSDGTTLLTNGVEYCVQVRAVNNIGFGPASNDVCSTPKTVPDTPSLQTVTPRDRAIDVAYALGGNGGSPITDVEYCLASCNIASNWVTTNSVTSPFRIANLTNGVSYQVNLRAVNSVGTSSADVAISSVIPANNPSAPNLTSVVAGAGQATLNFTAPASDGGIAITNYQYTIDGGTTWTSVSPASTATSITITGLTNGTNYNFGVRAFTPSSIGQSSSLSSATPSTIPSAPASVVTTPLSGRISVSFTAPDSGGSPITTYKYALSTNAGSSYGSWVSTNSTSTSFTISGLTNGTAYLVKVLAVNLNGNGVEAVAGSSVTPVGVPESPVISSVSNSSTLVSLTDRQLAVYFTEPANNGSAISNYQYSTDNGVTWRNRTDATGRFSPLIISKLSSDGTTDLSVGTNYPVLIKAVNANGTGDPSQVFAATTGGFVDVVPPTATLASSGGSTSSSRTLTFVATFSETVSDIQVTDFVKASGTATCSVTSVSATSGTTINVVVTCTTDGTIALRLNANSVTDGTNTGPVSSVTSSTVTINSVVVQAQVSTPSSTSTSRTLSYTVDFSSSVSGIAITDFVKASGTASCSTIAASVTSGASVTFTVLCSTDGTVVMRLSAYSVTNGFSTAPAAAVDAATVTIDSSVPTATISSPGLRTSLRSLAYVVTFSENISGVSASDFVQIAGTSSCTTTAISGTSGTVITFTVTCSNDGTVQMQLLSNSVTDGVNMAPVTALNSSTSTIDQLAPTATIASPAVTVKTRTLSYTINFSEYVSGIQSSNFVQSSGTATCVTTGSSQSGGTSATFAVTCSNDGTVVMKFVANSVTDGIFTGPVAELLSREVNIDTSIPVVVSRTTTQPITNQPVQPTAPLPQQTQTPRVPTYVNGALPRVTTASPLVIISGAPAVAEITPLPTGGQQIALPAGATIVLDAVSQQNGRAIQPSAEGIMQVYHGDMFTVEVSGLKPGTTVELWLFSTPKFLGSAVVAADGTLTASFEIPAGVHVGAHTAQFDAVSADGSPLSVNTALHVSAAEKSATTPGPGINLFAVIAVLVLMIGVGLAVIFFIRRKRHG